MIDQLAAFRLARREFESRLDSVETTQLALPTPCAEWDVETLIQHVIDGDTFAALILGGASLAEAIATLRAETDPRVFATEANALDEAFARAALGQTVDHPVGRIPVEDFLKFRATDYTGHAWDLARATGQNESLDPHLIEHLWGSEGHQAELQEKWLDQIGRQS